MRTTTQQGYVRALTAMQSGWPEATFVLLLACAELAGRLNSHTWHPGSLLVTALCFAGAGLSGFRPRLGAAVYLLGLVGALPVPPDFFGLAEFASLVVIMALVARRHRALGAAFTAATLGLLLLAPSRHATLDQLVHAFVGWLVLLSVGWLLGSAVRGAREAGRTALEETLRAQRREIAAELHDNVTHDLALIIMRAEQATLARGGRPTETLEFMAATARRCNENTRRLMTMLSGTEVTTTGAIVPLGTALDEAVRRLRTRGFAPALMQDGDPASLPRSVEATLARVTREATNNIVRHGDPAAPVSIMLMVEEHRVDLAFINRTGAHSAPGSGVGTGAMRERVRALGGEFVAASHDDQWRTQISVPF